MAAAICVMCLGPAALTSRAQESRAGEIAAKQEEKARGLRPYVPNVVERVLLRLEQGRVHPPPVTFTFDTVYSGGGLTGDLYYRRHYGDRSNWYARGAYSVRHYKLFEVGTTVPDLGRGRRLTLSTKFGWRDATQVGYWGVGMDTTADDRANYRFKQSYGEVRADYLLRPWLPVSAGVTYEGYKLLEGKGRAPSIEDVYTPDAAPGLGDSPDFIHSDIRAAIDTRPPGEYARRGGEYSVALHQYSDLNGGTYSFSRLEAGALQHIPILRETWVLSMRARLRSTISSDSVVPYFLLPTVGGSSSLRAYSSWRFRDRHAADANLEWRWIPNRAGLDLALFFDAGQVTDEVENFRPNRFVSAVGVGVRLHARQFMVLRTDVAHGSDGWHVTFSTKVPF